jgi:hypothetical protein
LQSRPFHDLFNTRFNVRPTAIKTNDCSAAFEYEVVVFRTEHLAAQWFQDDATPWNGVDFFVKA